MKVAQIDFELHEWLEEHFVCYGNGSRAVVRSGEGEGVARSDAAWLGSIASIMHSFRELPWFRRASEENIRTDSYSDGSANCKASSACTASPTGG